MRGRCRAIGIGGLASLWLVVVVSAQYGHPLKGSWSGDWGTSASNRNRVLLRMDWDGENVDAVLNPGADGVPLTVDFDPATWTVRMHGEVKDASGAMVSYQIEGKLENLGSPNRQISGTWMQGAQKGDFLLNRN